MKIDIVKLVDKKSGKDLTLSTTNLIKEIKKNPKILERYTFEVLTKEIPSFKFIAWIHPKSGGDDYQVEIDQCGNNITDAKIRLESYLAKTSAVVTDYELAK